LLGVLGGLLMLCLLELKQALSLLSEQDTRPQAAGDAAIAELLQVGDVVGMAAQGEANVRGPAVPISRRASSALPVAATR
jgi:hypothetical protein